MGVALFINNGISQSTNNLRPIHQYPLITYSFLTLGAQKMKMTERWNGKWKEGREKKQMDGKSGSRK
jgi:hypothetical protein